MRVLVLLLCVSRLAAQKPPVVEELFEEKLAEQIRSVDAGLNGVLGVFLIDLVDRTHAFASRRLRVSAGEFD